MHISTWFILGFQELNLISSNGFLSLVSLYLKRISSQYQYPTSGSLSKSPQILLSFLKSSPLAHSKITQMYLFTTMILLKLLKIQTHKSIMAFHNLAPALALFSRTYMNHLATWVQEFPVSGSSDHLLSSRFKPRPFTKFFWITFLCNNPPFPPLEKIHNTYLECLLLPY